MKINIIKKFAIIIAGFGMLSSASQADCGKVQIADMNWASAAMLANIDKAVFTAMGCEVEMVAGSTMPTFTSMNEKDSPDVAPELWANAVSDLLDEAVDTGRLFIGNAAPITGLGEGWWVLPHTLDAHPELKTVLDVIERPDLFPDKEDPSKGAFVGCPAGWGCQLSSASLFQAFDMEAKGWKLVDPGSAAGLDGSVAKASEQGENWFGYYWNPTSLVGKYNLQYMDYGVPYAGDDNWNGCISLGPEACAAAGNVPQPSAWVTSRVNTVISKNLEKNGSTEVMNYFKARTIPGTALNAELVWAEENNGTGADAALHFLSTSDLWKSWVSADVAAAVEAAL